MSRFETSKFIKNPEIMNQEVLMQACKALKWEFSIKNDELVILNIGEKNRLYGEYAIKVKGNIVSYNNYYLGNAPAYVNILKEKFCELNVEYSKNTIINSFKNKGFTYKSNDKFISNDIEKVSFYMVGRSKDKTEKEPIGEIKFTILNDGTIISDSNYLPDDINKLAHEAMDNIDFNFESKRIMTKKEVPLKYKNRLNKDTLNIKNISKNKSI